MYKVKYKLAIIAILLLSSLFLACSQVLNDKNEVADYVKDNLGGLNSFVESVSETDEFFESITHTKTHPIKQKDADYIDGMYATGIINNSLFYEEVNYEFVEEPLEKGIIDTITMYTDYTLSYQFICNNNEENASGFYYSETDKALLFGKEYDFTEKESGFSYTLSNGSEYYTEKICDNWYYYIIDYKS